MRTQTRRVAGVSGTLECLRSLAVLVVLAALVVCIALGPALGHSSAGAAPECPHCTGARLHNRIHAHAGAPTAELQTSSTLGEESSNGPQDARMLELSLRAHRRRRAMLLTGMGS
jgi:hypothetical protein